MPQNPHYRLYHPILYQQLLSQLLYRRPLETQNQLLLASVPKVVVLQQLNAGLVQLFADYVGPAVVVLGQGTDEPDCLKHQVLAVGMEQRQQGLVVRVLQPQNVEHGVAEDGLPLGQD